KTAGYGSSHDNNGACFPAGRRPPRVPAGKLLEIRDGSGRDRSGGGGCFGHAVRRVSGENFLRSAGHEGYGLLRAGGKEGQACDRLSGGRKGRTGSLPGRSSGDLKRDEQKSRL